MAASLPAVDLERLAADARAAGRLGLDTEFMTEGRYHPLLCLVQLAVADPAAEDGIRIELIDPLTHDDDPAPLAAVLADPDIDVVLHAARADVAILRRAWRTAFRSVWDTQVAAGFAGFSAQAGYTNLLAEALDVRAPKSAGFTRWDVRPLSDEQLEYARGDVRWLLQLADTLGDRLARSGRADWVRDECRPLEESTDVRDPAEVWRRLPKVNGLSGRSRAVARELAGWREQTAANEDRPVGSVLADAPLVELARRAPADSAGLGRIRGLHPPVARRRGDEILAAIARGQDAPELPREQEGGLGLEAADAPVVALSEALLRQRALEAGLAYELLATRADLNRVVALARRDRPEPDVRVLGGWRRELAGEELLALLAGQRVASVDDQGRLRVGVPDREVG